MLLKNFYRRQKHQVVKKKVKDLRKDREHIYSFCLDEIIWL